MTLLLLKILLGGVFLLASIYTSLAETSLMSLSSQQLNRLRRAHPGRLDFWAQDPDRALAVLLLCNNAINVGLGVLSTSMAVDIETLWGLPLAWGVWLVGAVTALVVIVAGEIFPKVLARLYPEAFALGTASAARTLTDLLGPLVGGLVAASEKMLAALARVDRSKDEAWNVSVIRTILQSSGLTASLRSMLNNLLDFGKLPVGRVMVPREEVFAVDLSTRKEGFIKRILTSGYSRVLVTQGSLDNVVGLIYAKDLLTLWRSGSLIVWEDLLRPVPRVSPGMPLAQVLRDFRQGKNHLAIVVENGKLEGLVTMQDALEAIVGAVAEEPELRP